MLYLDHLRAEAFLFYSVIVGRAVVQRGDIAPVPGVHSACLGTETSDHSTRPTPQRDGKCYLHKVITDGGLLSYTDLCDVCEILLDRSSYEAYPRPILSIAEGGPGVGTFFQLKWRCANQAAISMLIITSAMSNHLAYSVWAMAVGM